MNIQIERRQQSGFSLIELMVALVVSLILLAGILQILLGNRESTDAQKALASLQDNTRLISFKTRHVIAHAGYLEAINSSLGGNPAISGTPPDEEGNDTITIRFRAADDFPKCNGGKFEDSDEYKTYSVEFSVSDGALRCKDSADNKAVALTPEDTVVRFKVRYGLDTDAKPGIDTYKTDPKTINKHDVRSVRLQILLKSERNVLPKAISHSYTFVDDSTFSSKDRLAYQMVDQTIAIRNRPQP